jgi:hypothetical protein
VPLLAWTSMKLLSPFWDGIKRRTADALIAEKGSLAKPAEEYIARMDALWESLRQTVSGRDLGTPLVIALTAAFLALIWMRCRGRIGRRPFQAVAVLLIFADLTLFCRFWGTGFVGNAGPIAGLEPDAQLKAMCSHAAGGPGRWAEFASAGSERLTPNSGLHYDVWMAGGYSPLLIKAYHELVYDLGFSDGSLGRPTPALETWTSQRGVLDLIGARWVRSTVPLDLPGLELRETFEGTFFYENTRALPEAVLYTDWTVMADEGERLRYLKSDRFDPAAAVVLHQVPPAGFAPRPGERAATVRTTRVSSTVVEMETDSDTAGILLFQNTLYPGWSVSVDGAEADILAADHAFLAAALSAGRHRVRFEYRPFRPRAGGRVSQSERL